MNDDLERAHRRATLIGGAMLGSLLVYVVAVEVLRATLAPFRGFAEAPALPILRWAFLALSVGLLALARVTRARLLAGAGAAPAARLFTASVVSLALAEAIAVYGLVLFLVGGQVADFYGFLLLALVGIVINFPRRHQWEARARETGD